MSQAVILPAELEEARDQLKTVLDVQEAPPLEFNFNHWFEEWLTRQQPALGNSRPVDLLGTPKGIESVCRVLGASMSSAYQ